MAILVMGLPIYAGLRYFLYRRRLSASLSLSIGLFGLFLLYAGLAFLLASPLAGFVHGPILTTYLFITCILTALTIVELIDLFLILHYLSHIKKIYISPPMRTIVKIGIFCIAILPILRFVLDFNPLALVAIPTIASAGIAFALQDTLKAFIAGVGLGNLIRLGEWIAFQDKEGRVINIDWARTTLETTDGQRLYIPNNLLLSGAFLNYTTGNPSNRQVFKISVTYDAPPAQVKESLLHCARDISGIAENPAPQVVLMEYADSGIVYGLTYWLINYSQKTSVQDDVATRIWYALRRDGIAIPYPTRTIQIQRKIGAETQSASEIQASLQRWNLAEAFYAEELKELSACTRPRSFAPGESIVHQGEKGNSLFVILAGEVDVVTSAAPESPVATLGPKDIFGEMSLLTGEPRSATVRAKSAVELLEVEKGGLQKILSNRPQLSDRLAELVLKRRTELASKSAVIPRVGAPVESDQSLAKKIQHFFGLA